MRASLFLMLADPLLWSSFWYARCQEDEFAKGRTYILRPLAMSWSDAAEACVDLGGTLAKIRSIATIPALALGEDVTVWIGLSKRKDKQWSWEDTSVPGWSNWKSGYTGEKDPDEPCVAARIGKPHWWEAHNCSIEMPSLCELPNGTCTFIRFEHASIIGEYRKFLSHVDVEDCWEQCQAETEYSCRSFEYKPKRRVCQLNDMDRYMMANRYATNDMEADYYHRTCDSGRVYGLTTEPIVTTQEPTTEEPTTEEPTTEEPTTEEPTTEEPTTEEPTTEEPTTEATTIQPTTTETELETLEPSNMICFVPKVITDNMTEPEEVKELQSMNAVFKKRQVTLKRISVADYRPSANYVGSTAVIIAFSLIGSVVICDIGTLLRHVTKAFLRYRKNRKPPKQLLDFETRDHLRICDHMNAVTRHMQYITKNSERRTENGDMCANGEVVVEHPYIKVLDGESGEEELFQNGDIAHAPPDRKYDWSEEEPCDVLQVEIEHMGFHNQNDNDSHLPLGVSKITYRTFISTHL